jgi:hypothetical protein
MGQKNAARVIIAELIGETGEALIHPYITLNTLGDPLVI